MDGSKAGIGLPMQARSRQCAEPGCGKRPVFNMPGEKLPIWCQAHKMDGMVDVLNRLCTHPGKAPSPAILTQITPSHAPGKSFLCDILILHQRSITRAR